MPESDLPRPESGDGLRVRCFEGAHALRQAVAERLADEITRDMGSPFAVLLSGGSTPYPAYNDVAEQRLVASPRLHLGFTDDRYVPPESPYSNYRNTRPLIESLGLPEARVLRVRTDLPLGEAAADYADQLYRFLGEGGEITLAFLGLGADGHTCSLFLPKHVEQSRGHLAIAVHRPDGRNGVTVTPELLQRATTVVFLVSGEEKQSALRGLVQSSPSSMAAQIIAGHPSVEVWTEPGAWPGQGG